MLGCAALSSGSAHAQAAPPAAPIAPAHTSELRSPVGQVDLVTGRVDIATTGQAPRGAVVGGAVYEGDQVLTGDASEALITMADQGFIAVRANSRVQILSYKADGGDDDNGIFRLAAGGMRSVTGWIGKFNRRAYRIQTPTATIGIRGTDHETRVLPQGSAEGTPGTYDKVFIGLTSIETDAGQVDVGKDAAGFVGLDDQHPHVLEAVPEFFKPGPNEDLINAKHAEIQNIIEQRRADRQRVVEKLRQAMNDSLDKLKTQGDLNKLSSEQRAAAGDEQRAASEQKRAALLVRQQALEQQRKVLAEVRTQIVQKVGPFIGGNRIAGRELKAARENNLDIAESFKQLAVERRNMNQNNIDALEARKRAADEHQRQANEKLAALRSMLPDLQQRNAAIEQMGESVRQGLRSTPAGSDALNQQRRALAAAVDSATAQRHLYQDGMNALFEDNMAFASRSTDAAIAQRLATDQQISAFNVREDDLVKRQANNDRVREAIQLAAVTDATIKAQVQALIEQAHTAMAEIVSQRTALRDEYNGVHHEDFVSGEQRQQANAEQIRVIKERHAEFTGKLADLEAESAAMQAEIRSLYTQEQRRYLQELNAARADQPPTPLSVPD